MFIGYRFAFLRSLSILGVALALLAFPGVRPAHGVQIIIVVDSTADDNTANGNCTLREAIIAANTNAAVDHCFGNGGGLDDVIQFDLESNDIDNPTTPPRISIGATPLPDITERVHIEGNQGNSHPPRMVEIRGPGAPLVSGHNGLTIAAGGAGTIVEGLVINGAADDGVLILADEVTLYDDRIGTDAAGQAPIQNQGFGVQVRGNGDRIGSNDTTNCPYGCDLISGNAKANILLDTTSTGARVMGIHVGTSLTGQSILQGTSIDGIIDKGGSNRIGEPTGTNPQSGSCEGGCNVIVGVPEAVLIDPVATNSKVQSNYIGIDGGGSFDLTDSALNWGIISKADGVTIGGATPETRNVIAGADQANVLVEGHNSVVEGNYIGTKSTGAEAIPGTPIGVQAYLAVGAVIGGTVPGSGNLISGTSLSGVDILQSTGVLVMGNYIGTAADGVSPLVNSNFGVLIEQGSSNNFIGGTADGTGNTIAFHGLAGVRVDGSVPVVHANTIRRNSIYSNDGGIDLRIGANDGILPPTITSGSPLSGSACAGCAVEIFSDAGNEGKKFEGTVLAAVSGTWTFNGTVSGPIVTATQTDLTNNTSEFSVPYTLVMQGDLNCDGFIDGTDFDVLLNYAGGLNDGMTLQCFTLADTNVPGGYAWGDLNCDGFVDAVDALYLLAYRAGIFLPPENQPCVPIGQRFA